MKKIINGKLYDTNTATLIDSYTYSDSKGIVSSTDYLYQKKTGEFFLYNDGGLRYGPIIIPECNFDVKQWVADLCDADTYIKLFGAVEE